MKKLSITGGCQCGAVRYSLCKAPSQVYLCHCSVCRRVSTSAFNVSCIIDADAITIDQGQLSRIEWVVGDNIKRFGEFCERCGVRIRHGSDPSNGEYALRGGTLDDQRFAQPVAHIWLSEAVAWFVPPEDDLHYDFQPPDDSEIEALYRARYGQLTLQK